MTEDELKAIEARYPNDEIHQLTSEVRRLRSITDGQNFIPTDIHERAIGRLEGVIARAGKRCLDETQWCCFCDGHHPALEDWQEDCPAFTPSGGVR